MTDAPKNLTPILEQYEKELPEGKQKWENPICIIAVDFKGRYSLIEVLNEESVHPDSMDMLNEEFDGLDCDGNEEPGLYKTEITWRTWQDNTPDSCDWNCEMDFSTFEKVW